MRPESAHCPHRSTGCTLPLHAENSASPARERKREHQFTVAANVSFPPLPEYCRESANNPVFLDNLRRRNPFNAGVLRTSGASRQERS